MTRQVRIRDAIALQLALDFDLPTFKAREAAVKVMHLLAREGYLHVEEMEWQKDVAWQEEPAETAEKAPRAEPGKW